MEDEKNRILGSSNWSGWDKDGEGEDEEYIELANAKVCQGYTEVLGVSKLLSPIY